MGKRRQWAALGATFALLVAACAATNPSETFSADATTPVDVSAEQQTTAAPNVTDVVETDATAPRTEEFPESLADASFVQPPRDDTCATSNHANLAVFAPTTGELRSTLSIPRPAPTSALQGSTAFLGFGFDNGQRPGVGAVDVTQAAPLWQRFLASEPQDLTVIDDTLIVVTSEDVRGLDPETGQDRWILDSQFEIRSIVLGSSVVFALDQVGVHAIDPATGDVLWQLAIDRPDTIAASEDFLAVASRTRLIGVDINAQQRLFDIDVDRSGNDGIWVADQTVIHELSATVAPGGGVASIDLRTGAELWRETNIGETVFTGGNALLASTANAEPNPGTPFVLFALDAYTGERLWETPATAQVFEGVIGFADNRVVFSQPHQALPGLRSVRMLNSADGSSLWEVSTDLDIDHASIGLADFVALYGARSSIGGDRGVVAMRAVSSQWWTASTAEGILQDPALSPAGLVVVAGERSPACVARAVGEPTVEAEVLGVTESRQ